MLKLLQNRLAPFGYSNYRKFFFFQTLSVTGTWANELARAWLVLQLVPSATAVGGVMMASAIPSLFFILKGGAIVDRLDPKKLMITTKTLLGFSAIFLALLAAFGDIKYWHILAFAVFDGVVSSFDFPAFQAVAARLVPKKDFQQVMALNSTNFHLSRALGPLVAGTLMATRGGPAVVFFLDGLSFLFLAFGLKTVHLISIPTVTKEVRNSFDLIIDGFRYAFTESKIRYLVIQFLISVSLVYPMSTAIFRAFFRIKFELNTEQFGFVFACSSFGAMLGALLLTSLKPRKPYYILRFAIPILFIVQLTIATTDHLPMLNFVMFVSGIFGFLVFASTNMSIYLEVSEEYRGRIASLIGLGWLCIGPLICLPIGKLGDWLGYQPAIITISGIFLGASGLLAFFHRSARST